MLQGPLDSKDCLAFNLFKNDEEKQRYIRYMSSNDLSGSKTRFIKRLAKRSLDCEPKRFTGLYWAPINEKKIKVFTEEVEDLQSKLKTKAKYPALLVSLSVVFVAACVSLLAIVSIFTLPLAGFAACVVASLVFCACSVASVIATAVAISINKDLKDQIMEKNQYIQTQENTRKGIEQLLFQCVKEPFDSESYGELLLKSLKLVKAESTKTISINTTDECGNIITTQEKETLEELCENLTPEEKKTVFMSLVRRTSASFFKLIAVYTWARFCADHPDVQDKKEELDPYFYQLMERPDFIKSYRWCLHLFHEIVMGALAVKPSFPENGVDAVKLT